MSPYANVYLDMVFLINFTMDFVILWAAAKLGRINTNFKGLILGAFVGALYAIMIFLPALSWSNTILVKILCSVIMVIVAYQPSTIRGFLKSTAYFYLISFVMGGAVLGSMYLFESNPLILETWNGIVVNAINFKTIWLLAGLLIALIIGVWGASYIRQNLQQGPWLVKVELKICDKNVETEALVDTGNQLTDPITKDPVMVIEHKRLVDILPQELIQMLNQRNLPSLDELIGTLKDPTWLTRIRLIPFTSLGNPHGMLIGIKPDEVLIQDGNKRYINKNVILGIYHLNLCSKGTYHALVHPEMLHH